MRCELRRFALAIWAWMVLILGLPAAELAAQNVQVQQVLPPQPCTVVQIHNVQRTLELLQVSALGKGAGDPELQPFLSILTQRFREFEAAIFKPAGQPDSVAQLLTYLAGDAVVASYILADENDTGTLVCFQVKPEHVETMHRFLASVDYRQMQVADSAEVLPEFADYNLEHQGLFALGPFPVMQLLRKNLLAEQQAPGLAQETRFQELMKRVHAWENPQVQLAWFIDLRQITRLTRDGESDRREPDTLEMLGYDHLQALAGSLSLAEDQLGLVKRVHLSLDQVSTGASGWFEFETPALAALEPESWVPAEATSYRTLKLNLPESYAKFKQSYAEIASENRPEDALAMRLSPLFVGKWPTTIDFEAEFLPHLTGRISRIQLDDRQLQASSSFIAIEVANRENFLPAWQQLSASFETQAEPLDVEGMIYWAEKAEPAAEDTGFRAAPRASMAFIGHHLVLADSHLAMQQLLRHQAEVQLDEFAQQLAFREVIRALQSKVAPDSQLAVVSTAQFKHWFRRIHSQAEQPEVREEIRFRMMFSPLYYDLNKALESKTLPRFEFFEPFFAPSGSVVYRDSTGWHFIGVVLSSDPAVTQ